jgi:hypothetical protein
MRDLAIVSNRNWSGGKRLARTMNIRYTNEPHKVISINWGCSSPDFWDGVDRLRIVNRPEAVAIASNKLKFFVAALGNVSVPEFTTHLDEAKQWNKDGVILGRDSVCGRGGEGITVCEKNSEVKFHTFYTKYVPKEREFRFHVHLNKVFWMQEKLWRKGIKVKDKRIRGGKDSVFCFKHLEENPIPLLEEGKAAAIEAVRVCGLHFGAVDIGFGKNSHWVVYEVNTAPGLEGTTVKKYAEAFNYWRGYDSYYY